MESGFWQKYGFGGCSQNWGRESQLPDAEARNLFCQVILRNANSINVLSGLILLAGMIFYD
jgi:hypothetical protein